MTAAPWVPVPGDDVFLSDGSIAQYIAPLDGTHVVRFILDRGDPTDEIWPEYGSPFETDRIFQEAPVVVKSAEVVALDLAIADKRAELDRLRADLIAVERDGKARLAALQRHKGMERLEQFLDRKLTHVVKIEYDWHLSVLELKEAFYLKSEGRGVDSLKLLSLYGKTDGSLVWRLNQYSDGSGYSTEVIPCLSLEDAQAVAWGRLQALFERVRGSEGREAHRLEELEKTAQTLGRELPRDLKLGLLSFLRERVRAKVISAQKVSNESEVEFNRLECELARIQGEPHAD